MINRIQHNFLISVIFMVIYVISFYFLRDEGEVLDFISSNYDLNTPIIDELVYLGLFFLLAYQFTLLINGNKFFDKNVYSPLLLLSLIAMMSKVNNIGMMYLLINNLVLMMLRQLVKVQSGIETRAIPFNTSFLVGLMGIFYVPLYFLESLIFVALSGMRTANLREVMASVIGLLLPFISYQMISYISETSIEIGSIYLGEWSQPSVFLIVFYSLLMLVMAYFSLVSFDRMSTGSIFEKGALYLFFTHGVIMLGMIMLIGDLDLLPTLMLVPFTFLTTNFWYYFKNIKIKTGMIAVMFILFLIKLFV